MQNIVNAIKRTSSFINIGAVAIKNLANICDLDLCDVHIVDYVILLWKIGQQRTQARTKK